MPQQSQHLFRTAGIVLAATLAVTALGGCGGVLAPEKVLTADQLKSELLTAPVGSRPYSQGTLAPGGILNRDQFVGGVPGDQFQDTEKRDLDGDGFKYAVETNWDALDGTNVDVYLVQFARDAGAQDFVSWGSASAAMTQLPVESLVAVPGIPGAEAYTAGALDQLGYIRNSAWFSVGNVAVDLHYYTDGAPEAAGLKQLSQAQYTRLTSQVTTPSPLPTSARTAPAPVAANASDQSRLVSDLVTPPADSRPWPDDGRNGPTGILTLQQFVTRFATTANQPKVTAEETTRGFQYAVREDWVASDGTEANVQLLQFASVAGAQSFTLNVQGGTGNVVGSSGSYAIPDSGDARAFEHAGLNGNGKVWTESYAVVGDIAVNVDLWVPAKADRAAATALIQRQYAKVLADPTIAAAAQAAPPLPTPSP
ncbi:hypothetical protein P3T36_000277 [Kitasatospora sp. MAP12-15]|uniref:hypothetical protein n=1 Tax=unclassified Kitasatospora TaxID=2633591 RepID=UPI00247446D8|nr:hypothetical protein [Kitasatospora sp. MAP12-44]MDH6109506.1 hypothetical protein [Kitasatospora sp. MAP12-44]